MPHPSEGIPFEPDPNCDPMGVESLVLQGAFMARVEGIIGFCEEWRSSLPSSVKISTNQDGPTEVTLTPPEPDSRRNSTRVMLYQNQQPDNPDIQPVIAATLLARTPVKDILRKRGLYFMQDGRVIWQTNPVRKQMDGRGFMTEVELSHLEQREAHQGDIAHVSRYLDNALEKCGLPVAERFL